MHLLKDIVMGKNGTETDRLAMCIRCSKIWPTWIDRDCRPGAREGEGAWISMEDRQPDDGADVIVLGERGGPAYPPMKWKSDGSLEIRFKLGGTLMAVDQATHWLPLPKLPEAKGGRK